MAVFAFNVRFSAAVKENIERDIRKSFIFLDKTAVAPLAGAWIEIVIV